MHPKHQPRTFFLNQLLKIHYINRLRYFRIFFCFCSFSVLSFELTMEKDKDCSSLASETTDEKTVQSHNKEKELLASKSAPLTTLESLEIASRTMSRQRTHHSIDEEKDEKEIEVFRQQPYHTEGLRNPGWLAVISCFLGTFVVYGIMYSWGNYQKL